MYLNLDLLRINLCEAEIVFNNTGNLLEIRHLNSTKSNIVYNYGRATYYADVCLSCNTDEMGMYWHCREKGIALVT